jgi:hypothetical protein
MRIYIKNIENIRIDGSWLPPTIAVIFIILFV